MSVPEMPSQPTLETKKQVIPLIKQDTGGLQRDITAPTLKEKESEEPVEIGGPKGPEPTRYGDWEKDGRCSDF